MMLTPRQIALLRATLPMLAAHRAAAAAHLGASLLSQIAALRTTWAHTGQSRARRLLDTLIEAAALIEAPDRARIAVSLLAHDLRGQGLSPRDYVALHAALTDAVAATLRISEGAEVEDAWAEAIGAVLAMMLAEAHGPRRATLSLAA